MSPSYHDSRPTWNLPKESAIWADPVSAHYAHRAGPIGQVQKIFEEVRRLPRRQQQKVIDVVAALLEQYRRKAS